MNWIFVPLIQVFVFLYSCDFDDENAYLSCQTQKNIYAKASKIRFVSKHKWTSPPCEHNLTGKTARKPFNIKRVTKSLISIMVNSFEYSWSNECDNKA